MQQILLSVCFFQSTYVKLKKKLLFVCEKYTSELLSLAMRYPKTARKENGAWAKKPLVSIATVQGRMVCLVGGGGGGGDIIVVLILSVLLLIGIYK